MIWVGAYGGLHQGGISGRGENRFWIHLKDSIGGLNNRLKVELERKRGVKDDCSVLGPSSHSLK